MPLADHIESKLVQVIDSMESSFAARTGRVLGVGDASGHRTTMPLDLIAKLAASAAQEYERMPDADEPQTCRVCGAETTLILARQGGWRLERNGFDTTVCESCVETLIRERLQGQGG